MNVTVVGPGRWAAPAAALAAEHGLSLDRADADVVVLVGDDATLAVWLESAPDVPTLYVPRAASDLARMFGFTQLSLRDRLANGGPYQVDVIRAVGEHGVVPVIGHLIASGNGKLPHPWGRRRPIEFTRDGRETAVDATGLVVANAQHCWGHTLAPRAALMDGVADLQAFVGPVAARFGARRALGPGLHLRHAGMWRRTFSELVLDLPKGWTTRADRRVVPGGRWELTVMPGYAHIWA